MTHARRGTGNDAGDHTVTGLVEVANLRPGRSPCAGTPRSWAERLIGTTLYPGDLEIPLTEEAILIDLLQSHRLAAYHCTRLLQSEADRV
ncbi:MAG: hypothetical protein ACRCYU_22595 [Nocardioides sp.]